MYRKNTLPYYGHPLTDQDAVVLGPQGTDRVAAFLALRGKGQTTPLLQLPGLAQNLGIASLTVKDESQRLDLGSFKALGGAYALMVLVLQEAERKLGRTVDLSELFSDPIKEIASQLTFACATDGNHGRSVAQGAELVGAKAVIFVHSGVSQNRIDAIARFGAKMVVVKGNYDDSIIESARVANENSWIILSDTSWPGYEDIPALVGQGYTIIVREVLAKMDKPPTHVFLQAGVGGFASAIGGHLAILLKQNKPHITVVEPARAACVYESAAAGRPIKVVETEPTIMGMLDCYEPSMIAFRVLERVADGFMIIGEDAAVEVMKLLANPTAGDTPIVSGESGGVGLAGLLAVLKDVETAKSIGLGPTSRVLVINTEGATDPALYTKLVGKTPDDVLNAQG